MKSTRIAAGGVLLAAAAASLGGLAACGSSDKKSSSAKPTALALSISESGKKASFKAPATVKGGLTRITLKNAGKQPHSAQLVQTTGGHAPEDALKTLGSNSNKIPDWIRLIGGLGTVAPGQSASAVLNVPAGKYALVDTTGEQSGGGRPATKVMTVSAGKQGSLPSTSATITGANPSKDRYKWQISGALKTGQNNVTFASKGKEAVHFVGVVRYTGNHSEQELIKALKTNGPPPKYADQATFYNTALDDGGRTQTTPLTIKKPGKYLMFCPLTDRDGGKEHFEEGMLTTVNVK
jgi:hypothetical protein